MSNLDAFRVDSRSGMVVKVETYLRLKNGSERIAKWERRWRCLWQSVVCRCAATRS